MYGNFSVFCFFQLVLSNNLLRRKGFAFDCISIFFYSFGVFIRDAVLFNQMAFLQKKLVIQNLDIKNGSGFLATVALRILQLAVNFYVGTYSRVPNNRVVRIKRERGKFGKIMKSCSGVGA